MSARKSKKGSTFNHDTTAKSIYERLTSDRAPYITRAEDCAKYTIPSLFPQEGSNGSTNFDTPYQSMGARGVNVLSAKLMLALFPPNDSFFRLTPGDDAMQELQTRPEELDIVEQQLGIIEQRAVTYSETHQYRVTLAEAIKVLVVTGNGLLFLPPKEGGMKLYRLNSYVCQRDALGHVIQLVALDKVAYATLPDDVKSLVNSDGEKDLDAQIEIYTHVYLEGDRYFSYQEIDGEIINGSEQNYPIDKTPWIPLRMVKVDGESYGRSYIEEYLGDLKSLESLTKSIVEASAVCANLIYLVNPNGITRVYKLSKAKSGSFVPGRVEDVQPMNLNGKQGDFQTALATIQMLIERLSSAFMLNSAVQRNGDRVTAEEIRYVATELEDTLGGVYSILSQELQLPLVRRIMVQLESAGQIPELPDGIVEPTITTGMAAIGRGHDYQKLMTFLQVVGQNPNQAAAINWDIATQRIATALGIDPTNLIKSQEQMMQEQQQQQMATMAEKAAPQLAKGMVDQQQGGGM